MNNLNYYQNVISLNQQVMDTKEKDLKSPELSKELVKTEQKLLKQLIKSSQTFITNKDQLQVLSESLKRIFYHGLSLDKHVSTINFLRTMSQQMQRI